MSRSFRFWLASAMLVVFVWQLYEQLVGSRSSALPPPWGAIVAGVGAVVAAFEAWRMRPTGIGR